MVFIFWSQKTSEKNQSYLKIFVATAAIVYTWIPLDENRIFVSVLLTVFAFYVIKNEYRSLKNLPSKKLKIGH